jgi:hypothetical protein
VLEYNAPLSSGMAASLVFGQNGSFTAGLPNNGGVSRNSLNEPTGLALDALGNLYVVDYNNSRVLEYDVPLTTDRTADRVFGQPDFTSRAPNNGGIGATSLLLPRSVALDTQGNLYVADSSNNRVLVYAAPLTTDRAADQVFGQPDFTSNTSNNGGLSGASLFYPAGLTLDGAGNLYVADNGNHRVLEYKQALSSNHVADRVFGQPNFISGAENNGGVSAHSLFYPYGVALDTQNNLYVADMFNNRVLEYDWARVKIDLPLLGR